MVSCSLLVCMQNVIFTVNKIYTNCCKQAAFLVLISNKSFGGWGFAPDPMGGAYSAPPDPLAVFRGLTSKGRKGEKWEKRKNGDRVGRGGKKGRTRKGKKGHLLKRWPSNHNPNYSIVKFWLTVCRRACSSIIAVNDLCNTAT